MSSTLTMLFRRDPSRDRQHGLIHYEGYEILWPDGQPVALGLEAFCRHGQRLLGLGRYLAGCQERLVDILCFHPGSSEEKITRLPGHRVRRFFLERTGSRGRLHFMDGTPTEAVFDLGRDEPRVLHWLGLPSLADGARRWLDLAARPTAENFQTGMKHPTTVCTKPIHPGHKFAEQYKENHGGCE